MSDNNRELMKKDLAYILQLNKKINYDNITEVKKARNMVLQKNLFKTPLGQKYIRRLEQISSGITSDKCVLCGNDLDNSSLICTQCLSKYKDAPDKKGSAVSSENKSAELTEISKQAVTTLKGGLDTFTSKINELAGESGAVDLRLRDLFSGIFQKHTREESEEIFIAGTLKTTPAESDIAVSWPKPWLFSRVLMILLASYGLLHICVAEFQNPLAMPGLMFLGALAIPFSILIFIFETNAPRNISIFETIKMFFYGGTASLVLTLFLYTIFPVEQLDYSGAIIVGFVEELGKLLAIIIFVRRLNPKYILNGMLIGASIGAGFAVFETAGYAYRAFQSSFFDFSYMTDTLFVRGWSSLGSHVVWSAIVGAGLVMVKGNKPFEYNLIWNVKFQKFFFISVILHAIWDAPLMSEAYVIKLIILIAVAWIIILVMLNAGLKQIERICSAYRN